MLEPIIGGAIRQNQSGLDAKVPRLCSKHCDIGGKDAYTRVDAHYAYAKSMSEKYFSRSTLYKVLFKKYSLQSTFFRLEYKLFLHLEL